MIIEKAKTQIENNIRELLEWNERARKDAEILPHERKAILNLIRDNDNQIIGLRAALAVIQTEEKWAA